MLLPVLMQRTSRGVGSGAGLLRLGECVLKLQAILCEGQHSRGFGKFVYRCDVDLPKPVLLFAPLWRSEHADSRFASSLLSEQKDRAGYQRSQAYDHANPDQASSYRQFIPVDLCGISGRIELLHLSLIKASEQAPTVAQCCFPGHPVFPATIISRVKKQEKPSVVLANCLRNHPRVQHFQRCLRIALPSPILLA
jgi:hypothetical protein